MPLPAKPVQDQQYSYLSGGLPVDKINGEITELFGAVGRVIDALPAVAGFPSVAALLADTSMAYGAGNRAVAAGDVLEAGGHRYEVAASGASDHHVTTAGGVKLYALSGLEGEALGAAGDGVMDDTAEMDAAEAAAIAAGRVVQMRDGSRYLTTHASYNSLDGKYVSPGTGYILDSGNRRIPSTFTARAAPATPGNSAGGDGSPFGAFDYDALTPNRRIINIRGNDTTGVTPAGSGYKFAFWAADEHVVADFRAGNCNKDISPDPGDDRTAYVLKRFSLYHAGEGDGLIFQPNVQVWGRDGDATDILNQPAGGIYGGKVRAYANEVGVTYGEFHLEDGGYDTRGVGPSIIMTKDYTGAHTNRNWWEGLRLVSNGAGNVEIGVNLVGNFVNGISTAGATLSGGRALAIKSGQHVEFHAANSDSLNRYPDTNAGWTLGYEAGQSGLVVKAATTQVARFRSDYVEVGDTSDDASALRVRGASATAGVWLGQSGTTSLVSAGTTGAEATTLALRAADATGTEQTTLTLAGSGGHVNIARSGASLQMAGSIALKDGTGSPEGVVTAPVGALYLRRDGGAGTTLYVKETGTGNTGWVAK